MTTALIVALAVFAFAGILHVIRGTPVEQVLAPKDPDGPPGASDPRFIRTVGLLTGVRLEPGNGVTLLENGDETYPAFWRDVSRAERSLTMQMYYAKPGRLADEAARHLTERARAGVEVLLLLDAFGAGPLKREWIEGLRAAGVRVAKFRPLRIGSLHTVGNRSHVRAVVMDGRVGYTGGFGLADYWLGDGRHEGQWRETNVRVEGPAALQLQAAFVTAWAEATGALLTGETYFPSSTGGRAGEVPNEGPGGAPNARAARPADARGVRASVLYTTPAAGSTSAERFLALSIAAARRRLWITNSYFTPDDDLRRLLLQAVDRGVDVRVITAGPKGDVKTTFYAGRSRYRQLLEGGVRIWEYQPVMMHAKTLVADGCWGAVGAMNFDNRSLAHNEEATLVCWDGGVGRALEAMFERDLLYCAEITAAEWARRGLGTRVLEQAARPLVRLL